MHQDRTVTQSQYNINTVANSDHLKYKRKITLSVSKIMTSCGDSTHQALQLLTPHVVIRNDAPFLLLVKATSEPCLAVYV